MPNPSDHGRDRSDPRSSSSGEPKQRETDQARFEREKPRNPQGTDADRLAPTRDKHTGETNRNPQEIDPGTQKRERVV